MFMVDMSHIIRLLNTVFRYLVFSDPPGAKIGNGGATLHVFEQLEKVVGWEELKKGDKNQFNTRGIAINTEYAARVLLLHAGGYSQRLPSVSVVGKIFMGLPCGMFPDYYVVCYSHNNYCVQEIQCFRCWMLCWLCILTFLLG